MVLPPCVRVPSLEREPDSRFAERVTGPVVVAPPALVIGTIVDLRRDECDVGVQKVRRIVVDAAAYRVHAVHASEVSVDQLLESV